MKIWEHRSTLGNIDSFKGYLYRCAKNLLLDEVRRSQLQAKIFQALKPQSAASTDESDARIIYEQYYHIAQEAIRLLPEKRKQIVELRTRDELSLDEIAAKLSISKSVVKKQLYAGMAFVREYFHKNAEWTWTLLLLFPLP